MYLVPQERLASEMQEWIEKCQLTRHTQIRDSQPNLYTQGIARPVKHVQAS